MRTNITFLLFCLLLLQIACEKNNNPVIFDGDLKISGRLVFQNIEKPNLPIEEVDSATLEIVFLDKGDFVYTVKNPSSDFSFENLSKGDYVLRTSYTENNIPYVYTQDISLGNEDIRLGDLILELKPNATRLRLVFQEAATTDYLPNFPVCVFNNLAEASQPNNCESGSFQSNNYGVLIVEDLIALETYYLKLANQNAASLFQLPSDFQAIQTGAFQSLETVTFALENQLEAAPSLEVQVLDSLNNPISGAQVCIYTSEVIRDLDALSCANAVQNQTSDGLGKAMFLDLEQLTYFIDASIEVNGVILHNDFSSSINQSPILMSNDTAKVEIIIK